MPFERFQKSPALHFIVVFCFALAVRIAYLVEVADTPFYRHVTEPDSAVYIEQGKAIADGEGAGQDVFKMSPLYRYLVGIILLVSGGEVVWIRAAQLFIGALSCGLIYLIGRATFGALPGAIGAVILSLYAPAIFYESKILNEAWAIAANLGATLCLVLYRKELKPWLLAVCGVCLGLSCIIRANGLLLALLFGGIALFYVWDKERKEKLIHGLALVAGWCIPAIPVLLRNWLVGGQFVLLVTNLGPEFYLGSHPDSLGLSFENPYFIAPSPLTISEGFREQAMVNLGREVSHEEASRYWVWETGKAIVLHPVKYCRLLFRKLEVALNHFEPTDNTVYEFEKKQSTVLRFAFIGFGLLLAFAGPGLALAICAGRSREQLPLLACIAAYGASMILASVIGRYRLPAVPILAVFAGVAICAISEWVKHKKWAPLLVCFWGFSACLGFGFHENNWIKRMKRERMAEAYHRIAILNQADERMNEALEAIEQAVDWFPEGSSRYVIPGLPYEKKNPFSLAWNKRKEQEHPRLAVPGEMLQCARILEEGGSPNGAETVLRRALDLFRGNREIQEEFMGMLWRNGKREELGTLARRIRVLGPASGSAIYYLQLLEPDSKDKNFFKPATGFAAMRLAQLELLNGRPAQASQLYQLALKRDLVHSADAHYLFARCSSSLGDYAEANEHLETAATLNPDYRRFADYDILINRALANKADAAKPERLFNAYLRAWRIREARALQREHKELPRLPLIEFDAGSETASD